ncbi:MAG: HupE/UreJ family protein [Alphaproteobacteria bacterium]|nr:HupE/UreJ family protein [Alphaproteobacteria bacterium]
MPRCRLLLAALLALLLAAPAPAAAHTGGSTGFARISAHGQTVRYSLSLGPEVLGGAPGAARDLDALAALVAARIAIAADGRACAATPGTVTPPTADRVNVVVVVHYACAAPVYALTVRDDLAEALGADYHTLASFERAGGSDQIVFQPDRREARVVMADPGSAAPATGTAAVGALAFFELGIEHILLGFDHILFVVALLLGGGGFAALLAIVTAFTVAHSITLGLSVLDIVTLPASIVEPIIALSIAYVALENIVPGRRISRRWAVAFLFGLVHGFGFAGALAELELRPASLVASLLAFNLGVEAGQALVIALLLPPLLWIRRYAWQRRAVAAASILLLVAGLSLLVGRTLLS